jgi:hypothetical protein
MDGQIRGEKEAGVMGWNFARILALIPMALAFGATSASAAPILINFNSEPGCPDSQAVCAIGGNSFTSADSSLVHFSDTAFQFDPGNEMFLVDAPFTSNANMDDKKALAVGWDGDSSALKMVFDVPVASIGMNLFVGEGFVTKPGDMAVLTAFWDPSVGESKLVGTNSVNLSQEEISFDCVLFACDTFDRFNRVEIAFVGSIPGGMTEIVDNLSIQPIPEPHAAVVFGVGALLVGAVCRRRGRT